jgi:hypothetical protein
MLLCELFNLFYINSGLRGSLARLLLCAKIVNKIESLKST